MLKAKLPRTTQDLRDARGFSLAEVLVAVSMLIVAMSVVISSLMYGMTGVEGSRSTSTAVFLAEQRLEQVRAFMVSTSTTQGFLNLTSSSFPAETTITGYPGFRRTVTVTANAGGNADLQLITVTVFYKPTSVKGIAAETSMSVRTVVARR